MAITITEIGVKTQLAASRPIINDNFSILTSEINLMETYFNPNIGEITDLQNLSTDTLSVGLNTPVLDVGTVSQTTQSVINLYANTNINNSDLTIDGSIFRVDQDPELKDQSLGLNIDIGSTSTIPSYTIYRVSNNDSGNTLNINLYDGKIGQEIFFIYTGPYQNAVNITNPNSNLILPSGNTTVTLQEQGSTVKFLCIDDGTGNPNWYLTEGNAFTTS